MRYGDLSNDIAVVSVIDPDANAAGTLLGTAIDMAEFRQLMGIVMVGTLGSSATIDYAFYSCATSNGSYTAISGKAVTQLTQAGTDSDKQAVINLDASELPAGHRYVKDRLVVGTATSDCGSIVLGAGNRYGHAVTHDLAAVDEIVS